MRFYDRFLQIRRPENLPDRPHLRKFGLGKRGMGGGATRIGGLNDFDDTYFDFGLGMRFYDRFLQILRPENLPA